MQMIENKLNKIIAKSFLVGCLLFSVQAFSQENIDILYFEDLKLNELDSIDNKLRVNTILKLLGKSDKVSIKSRKSKYWAQPYGGDEMERIQSSTVRLLYKKYNISVFVFYQYDKKYIVSYDSATISKVKFGKSKLVSRNGFSFTKNKNNLLSGKIMANTLEYYFENKKLKSVEFIPRSWR